MLSKKELFNAKSSSNPIKPDMEIDVKNVGSYPDTDKDGNPVNVSVLVDVNDVVYSCISATIFQCLDLLDDFIADDGHAVVRVKESTSNSGRKFYQLQII